jgi:hypothetical protein
MFSSCVFTRLGARTGPKRKSRIFCWIRVDESKRRKFPARNQENLRYREGCRRQPPNGLPNLGGSFLLTRALLYAATRRSRACRSFRSYSPAIKSPTLLPPPRLGPHLGAVSKGSHEFRRPINVYFHNQVSLLSQFGSPHTFQSQGVDPHHLHSEQALQPVSGSNAVKISSNVVHSFYLSSHGIRHNAGGLAKQLTLWVEIMGSKPDRHLAATDLFGFTCQERLA